MLYTRELVPPTFEMSWKGTPLHPLTVFFGLELEPAAPVSQVTGLPGSQPAATGPTTWPSHGEAAPVAALAPSAPWKSTAGTPSLPKPISTSWGAHGWVVSMGFDDRAKSGTPNGAVSTPHSCFCPSPEPILPSPVLSSMW